MNLARNLMAFAVALAGTGVVWAAKAQDDASSASTCTVFLQRNQPDGIVDVTRQVLADGSCNCVIHTGGTRQGGEAQAQVAQVARSRACPRAHVMKVPPPDEAGFLQGDGRIPLASVLPIVGIADVPGDGVILVKEDIPAGP